jgi:hypothetical protein
MNFKDTLFALPWILLTILCWGTYAPVLHKGQAQMGHERLKPFICVGIAYLIVSVILPAAYLFATGKMGTNWSVAGVMWSLAGGTAGAVGALGIILALTSGGRPDFVMPLVFGAAPIVNVLMSMLLQGRSIKELSPAFLAGVIIVAVGAAMVLVFAPKAPVPKKPGETRPPTAVANIPASGNTGSTRS